MIFRCAFPIAFAVQAAFTGPVGLNVAQQWRPEIILLDIGLPGVNGYEVARRIRSGLELDLATTALRYAI